MKITNYNVFFTTQAQLPGQGLLLGSTWRSHSLGRPFAAFTGVPYASPPVGDLRFALPKSPAPFPGGSLDTEGRDVTPCPQMTFLEVTEGEEDCLQLNVFTPSSAVRVPSDGSLPSKNGTSNGPLPIVFFIHGGGFFTGDARLNVYGPEYFMDEDVVLVMPQYRLGPLGFLSFGEMGKSFSGYFDTVQRNKNNLLS